MKKMIAILLALVLTLSLAACSKEEQGITILNDLDWDLEDIYIVIAGAETWEEGTNIGYLDAGVGGYLYPESTFGSREVNVDIMAVDVDGDTYEVFDVPLKDGDSCSIAVEDGSFIFYVGEAGYEGLLSYGELPVPEDSGSEYVGFYETPDGFLRVYEDGTFEVMDNDGEVYNTGEWEYDDGLSLFADGETAFLVLDDYGDLYGGEDLGTFYRIPEEDQPVDLPNGDLPEANGYTESDYQGYWMYDSGFSILVQEDQWFYYADDGELLTWGSVEYTDATAELLNTDGTAYVSLWLDADGYMYEDGQELSYWDAWPYDDETDNYNDDLEGEWYYSDQENVLIFDGVDGFTWEYADGFDYGTYEFDGTYLLLYYDEGGYTDGYLDAEDCLWIDGDGGYYFRSEDF